MYTVTLCVALLLLYVNLVMGHKSANAATAAAAALPSGIRSVKQKQAAHGFDPSVVYGNVVETGTSVKAYRPALFEKLRQHCGILDEDYIHSLEPQFLQCLNSDSKSGQAFWVSTDGNVVVKTIHQYECKTVRKFLDSYALHVLTGPSTIGNILGLYRVKGKFTMRSKYILVCKNIYPSNVYGSSEKYDLKGSTVGRIAASSSTVLKDMNLLQSGKQFALGPAAKDTILRILQRDLEFLSKWRLMDYSLLVAIEQSRGGYNERERFPAGSSITPGRLSVAPSDGGKVVIPGANPLVFHFGIIDYLQTYTLRKWLETLIKSLYNDRKRISAVAPKFYAKRLLEFFANISE
jgi:1-phosphatidylinositol-4-phosphate 5-kinase